MSRCKNNQAKKTKSEDTDTLVEKFPLHLTNKQIILVRNLQREAAKVWNAACTVHRTIYIKHHCWLGEGAMKAFVKGKYGIHSQSAQAVVETYFECCERTKALHEQGYTDWRYPHRKKYFFTVTWKPLGIAHEERVLTLSNGRGREPLVLNLPKRLSGAVIKLVQLVWHRNQYWLHVTVEKPALQKVRGNVTAAIDPGEIHAATITDGKEALAISGRLLRSLNRLRNKVLRKFQKAIYRTKKCSKRRRELLTAKYRFLNNIERRIEHVIHTISAIIAKWCLDRNVKTVYIGNPDGVQKKDRGRKHNQRMSQWAFGELRRMLEYKLKRHGIKLVPEDERGTSGTCPACSEYTKQTGRTYKCGKCGFTGSHRDVVGASGILDKSVNGNFTKGRKLPEKVKYMRSRVVTLKKAA
ncbi:putative transposase [Desulfotomaculum arcticum]|uniref:Putative transposase n=1 Tax=Desulfotruncus arcticus DSM 17038 TaxID=1121424 RepID=A0A1I2QL46_9FIRM|nr:RNA-guided endonuclease TnpB family protein [Desulfotruncus arcticus]SFG28363.1 putative transposase [Desulfotomaculum arcticum] [Desulfotruncus arcticus DSM 17038]